MASSPSPNNTNNMDVDDPSSDDGEEMTAAELVTKVEKAWLNEKMTSDLLFPLAEEVDCLHEQIQVMQNNLQLLSADEDLLQQVHTTELNRIRYLLASYLRTRLKKIQEFCWYIKLQEDERKKLLRGPRPPPGGRQQQRPPRSKLLPKEHKFLLEYTSLMESYMTNVALHHMPLTCQKLDSAKWSQPPNLDAFIFLRCLKSNTVYIPDEDIELDLEEGSLYLLRYRAVSQLLTLDEVELI